MSSPQLPRTTSTANTTPASGDTGVRFDDHGVLPIPDSKRDCSPWELFWIWCGANIAPINWVLGALGIALGLSLIETLIVISVGNVFGCAVFGLFNVIGHRTAVNQMVLGRSAFGIAGAVLPALVQGLLTMAWVGVNTWVVLDLVLAVLEEIGIQGGMELKVVVATAIMVIQLALALYGFYAIRTFEKYTVPLTIAVMVAMTVVALARTHLDWTAAAAPTPGQKLTAVTQLITAIGVGWGLTWIPYAADYSRFARPTLRARTVFWASAAGMYLPTVWLAALGACLASAGGGADPSTRRQHLRRARRPGTGADHARPDRHQHPEPVLVLAGRADRRHPHCPLEDHSLRWCGGLRGTGRVHQLVEFRACLRQLDGVDPDVDQPVDVHPAR